MSEPTHAVTRRGVLAAGGAALLGAASGLAVGASIPVDSHAATASTGAPPEPSSTTTVQDSASPIPAEPFYGQYQSGIATAPTALCTFVGLDLQRASRSDALAVMRLITDDAARLAAGSAPLADTEPELTTNPAGLAITVGIGRQLLDRLDLGDRIPPELAPIPGFATDRFERPWGQTDLMLQVGSNDAITVAHVLRMLTKDLSTLTSVRWMQPGFRSVSPPLPGSHATRNLMGQIDGTVNPQPGTEQFDQVVWLPDGQQWWSNGTVLVLRRIRMLLDTWEELDRPTQETVIGRRIDTGAALGVVSESDDVPFDAVNRAGLPVIPLDAHIRVAHASTSAEMILRRPYSYDAGMRHGANDLGLLFAAYTRDPRRSFIPMQRRIATSDAFNRWNTTIGSASYLIPGGVRDGEILAERAFA